MEGRKALAIFGSLLILAGIFMPFLTAVDADAYHTEMLVVSYLKVHPYGAGAEAVLALAALELTRRGRLGLLLLPAILAALGLLSDGFHLVQHPGEGVHPAWGWAFFVIGPLALLASAAAGLFEPRPTLPDPEGLAATVDPDKVDIR